MNNYLKHDNYILMKILNESIIVFSILLNTITMSLKNNIIICMSNFMINFSHLSGISKHRQV